MTKNNFCLFLLLILPYFSFTQVGVRNIYEFLELPVSARVTALGDYLISVYEDDANLAYQNPALLNDSSRTQINFSQNFHLKDIRNGYFSYADYIPSIELNIHGGIQYINYGSFQGADEFGNLSGEFEASEMAFVVGASRTLNERFAIGSNLKYIFSSFESYRSQGMAMDLGGLYHNEEKRFSIGINFRNIGGQFTTYSNQREPLPFNMMIGFSKRLEHLPLRFSVTAHHLHRWNILYDDPNEENNTLFEAGAEPSRLGLFIDNGFRHLVFNGEFLIGPGGPLRLRVGYNHLRRSELRDYNFRSLAGFSGGFGIKARKWRVDYGFGIYHLTGSVHHLSFGTSINSFRNKREI